MRLAALRATALLDSPGEEAFDRLTRTAARVLGAPMALVTLVDEHRDFVKSSVGLAEPLASAHAKVTATFCQYAVAARVPVVLRDARADAAFAHYPAVTAFGAVASVNVPLITPAGHAIGNFCILDVVPRAWTEADVELLVTLAAAATTEVELRAAVREAEEHAAAAHGRMQEREEMLERIPEALFTLDHDWRFTFVNGKAEVLLEQSREALLGRSVWAAFPPAVRSPFHDESRRAVAGRVRDVTARREDEQAVRESDARLRMVMEQLPAVLWTTDHDLRLTSSLGAGLRVLGLRPDEAVGRSVSRYFEADDSGRSAVAAHHRALLGFSTTFETRYAEHTLQSWVEPLRAPGGEVTGVIGMALDVTERKQLEERLAHQAFHDPLTGLANRTLFRDRVEHALSRAVRGEYVAILFLDLDDFKTVNDSLGHAAGDRLLEVVATRLLRATRGCDTVARLGGDEFAVLLEGMAGPDDTAPVVERIAAAMRVPVALHGNEVLVGASVGVVHTRGGETPDELLRNADVAMYRAKEAGKGRHAVFEPAMHAAVLERLMLAADLRHAVDRGELRLLYQPVVELESGRVTGVEALVRWHHPERGIVLPAQFIPVAEETGSIVPIGRWVLTEACRQLAEWPRDVENGAAPTMSVNISGRQLQDAGLLGDVAVAIADTGTEPHRLTLEITESVIMQRTEATLATLHSLKALGVRLAIDDFGTGYSSLAYLQRFPIDILKIDKSFVDGIGHGGSDTALARTIIALGDMLRLRTVAEGVERADQRAQLRAIGCQHGQGYHFAKPLTAREVEPLLAAALGEEAACPA
jgi:diguanylate cyclase (GGDEF)-like protein/PAS domain S-box-containing protein